MKYLIPIAAIILVSCSGLQDELSDQEKIRDEVRSYLFLDDSVKVAANVVDTILVEELDGMLVTIEDNLMKIQMDIDTLGLMIDEQAYHNLEENQETGIALDEKLTRNTTLLRYQLKMADLKATKMTFQQSKRVMLHLRRAQLNSIAGYEVAVSYNNQGQDIELGFIVNTDFRIID